MKQETTLFHFISKYILGLRNGMPINTDNYTRLSQKVKVLFKKKKAHLL